MLRSPNSINNNSNVSRIFWKEFPETRLLLIAIEQRMTAWETIMVQPCRLRLAWSTTRRMWLLFFIAARGIDVAQNNIQVAQTMALQYCHRTSIHSLELNLRATMYVTNREMVTAVIRGSEQPDTTSTELHPGRVDSMTMNRPLPTYCTLSYFMYEFLWSIFCNPIP